MEKVARTADKIHSWREIRGYGTRLSRRKPRGPNFDFRQRVGRTPKLGSRTIRVEDCLRCLFGLPWGIGSSKPSPSTGESAANLTSRKRNIKEFKRNDFRRTALVWACATPFCIAQAAVRRQLQAPPMFRQFHARWPCRNRALFADHLPEKPIKIGSTGSRSRAISHRISRTRPGVGSDMVLDSSSENRRQKEFNNCRAKVRRQGDRRSVEWLCRRDGRRLRACSPACDGCQGSGESGCWQAGRRAVCERTGRAGRPERLLG
jgi:hypothetical protein